MPKKINYEEYKCPICGYDRELEGNIWICQHCGEDETREDALKRLEA